MIFSSPVVLVVVALVGISFLIAMLAHYFSPEARIERRRRRSHSRVVNKTRRPVVSLSVQTKK
jgi:hypothetical protein